MAWSGSAIFRPFVAGRLANTPVNNLDGTTLSADTYKVALYNNTGASTITPTQNVTLANSAYNADQWVVAGEVTSSTGTAWPAGGRSLGAATADAAGAFTASTVGNGTMRVDTATANVIMFDAADTASLSNATMANVFGSLIYNNLLTPKSGVCYNYFGGANGVSAGVLTIVWNANGIFRITV